MAISVPMETSYSSIDKGANKTTFGRRASWREPCGV
jgi:hypothetical protein